MSKTIYQSRADFPLTEQQIKWMEKDYEEAKALKEAFAGPANAFRFGWTMAASRAPSSDDYNRLLGERDDLVIRLQAIERANT